MDHTADLAVRLRAGNLEELFVEAARALFDLLVEGKVEARWERPVEVEAPDREELLVGWLRELLGLWTVEGMALREFELVELREGRLRARVRGEPFDPSRHRPRTEIKAITYHGLRVEGGPEGWSATLVFDV